jgi:hypothetical protein
MRAIILIFSLLLAGCAGTPQSTVWTFGQRDRVGGVAAHAEGKPKIIATGAGPAMQFDGVADALFVDSHPLAGAASFTVEAVFRPEGGPFEQRWLHLAEVDPKTGQETGTRFLFEIRVVGERWYLDAFTKGPGYNRTLIVPDKLFPIGNWYRVAMTYDGAMFRSYVDGVLQAEAPIAFQPQGAGRSSVGVRINRVNWFKGSVLMARFTPHALGPQEFLPLPDGLNPPAQ